ncbi:MAG: hypothetical protein IJS08_15810 [Victivallales bacterium]|nr:hypothetical protein [Victivallales bacterium]
MTDFELLVKKMRDKQVDYFKTRSPEVLREAKQLEYEVDKHLTAAASRDDNLTFDFMKRN